MATFNKYQPASEALVKGVNIATDTWRIILSNTAPDVTDTNQASASELTTANGYTVNGNTCAVTTSANASGVTKLVLADPTPWTATGAGFTVRYAILWNQTADVLFGWWDYGSSQLVDGATSDTFAPDLSAANGVFTVS